MRIRTRRHEGGHHAASPSIQTNRVPWNPPCRRSEAPTWGSQAAATWRRTRGKDPQGPAGRNRLPYERMADIARATAAEVGTPLGWLGWTAGSDRFPADPARSRSMPALVIQGTGPCLPPCPCGCHFSPIFSVAFMTLTARFVAVAPSFKLKCAPAHPSLTPGRRGTCSAGLSGVCYGAGRPYPGSLRVLGRRRWEGRTRSAIRRRRSRCRGLAPGWTNSGIKEREVKRSEERTAKSRLGPVARSILRSDCVGMGPRAPGKPMPGDFQSLFPTPCPQAYRIIARFRASLRRRHACLFRRDELNQARWDCRAPAPRARAALQQQAEAYRRARVVPADEGSRMTVWIFINPFEIGAIGPDLFHAAGGMGWF